MSTQALTSVLFISVVLVTVAITFWASRQNTGTADFYAGGRSFSGFQNGLAVSGDYMSAASFLGISGAIALFGYDGFLYSIGFLVAWLVALLLVAELLRNSGRYTMADQLAYRMRQRPVRTAAATSTVVVSIFYLLAQMVGAGALVTLLLGVTSEAAKAWVIVGVGLLMIFYVVVGGMKGTTWVQIVKAVLLMAGTVLITVLVLAKFHFNISRPARRRLREDGQGGGVPPARPALRRHHDEQDRLRQPRPGAGPRHRGTPPHPDPLLHGPHREGRAEVGVLGDQPDRRLLPDDAGAGLRRGGTPRHRRGQRGRGHPGQPGLATARRSSRWWGRLDGWSDPAGADLGRRLRHDPRGGRRVDAHQCVERRPRPLRDGVQARDREREGRGEGRQASRPSSSVVSRSCWPSRRRSSTSRSWWRWPSRSQRRRTCRR